MTFTVRASIEPRLFGATSEHSRTPHNTSVWSWRCTNTFLHCQHQRHSRPAAVTRLRWWKTATFFLFYEWVDEFSLRTQFCSRSFLSLVLYCCPFPLYCLVMSFLLFLFCTSRTLICITYKQHLWKVDELQHCLTSMFRFASLLFLFLYSSFKKKFRLFLTSQCSEWKSDKGETHVEPPRSGRKSC